MLKKICYAVLISVFLFLNSGCALLGTAISAAGIAYGIYQATKR